MPASTGSRCRARAFRSEFATKARIANKHTNRMAPAIMTSINVNPAPRSGTPRRASGDGPAEGGAGRCQALPPADELAAATRASPFPAHLHPIYLHLFGSESTDANAVVNSREILRTHPCPFAESGSFHRWCHSERSGRGTHSASLYSCKFTSSISMLTLSGNSTLLPAQLAPPLPGDETRFRHRTVQDGLRPRLVAHIHEIAHRFPKPGFVKHSVKCGHTHRHDQPMIATTTMISMSVKPRRAPDNLVGQTIHGNSS